MTSALILSTVADEPRVRDVDLATELGLAQPLNIRAFILRNMDELSAYGLVHSSREPYVSGRGRQGERTVFWLNRNQALLTCILSRTEKGRSIRAEVIAAGKQAVVRDPFGMAKQQRVEWVRSKSGD